MNRSFFYRLLALGCFIGGQYTSGYGQTSPYEHPNLAPEKMTPLGHLLTGVNNIMYGGYSYFGADQDWDTAQQHYTGNILTYLRYPEIPAAGYRVFSVKRASWTEGTGILYGADDKAMESTLDWSRRYLGEDRDRKKTTCYVNGDGWLTAIQSEQLYPQSQGFAEDRDSFDYVFGDDGSMLIKWTSDGHSSGSGNKSFQHSYRHSTTTLSLDRWHNVLKIESVSADRQTDRPDAGPAYFSKRLWYDDEGRLVRVVDSNGAYASRSSEYTFSYHTLPLGRFLDSVKDAKEYGPLRLPAVAAWLGQRGPLTYMYVSRTFKAYEQYDYKTRKSVVHADSPVVTYSHAQLIIDKKRQRVVSWDHKDESFRDPSSFALYERPQDPAHSTEGVGIRYLPYIAADPGSKLPLVAISGFLQSRLYEGHPVRYYQPIRPSAIFRPPTRRVPLPPAPRLGPS